MITQDDIIYFIVTDRFFDGDAANNFNVDKTNPSSFHGGDLKGIEMKLDYLNSIGITAIWITPVYINISSYNNGQPYHYYWPKDFNGIDEHLYSDNGNYPAGDKRYLKDFVDRCHQKKIKVILDVVVNHTGYDFGAPVFPEDWYRPDDQGVFSGLPKLDLANSNVVDYFVNNLLDWVGTTGIDGLRMDMAKHIGGYYIPDPQNPAQTVLVDRDFDKFWYHYKSMVKGKFPDLFIVGEVLDTSVSDIGYNAMFENQFDLNSIFDFPLNQVLKNTFIYNNSLLLLARPRLNDNETSGILDKDDPSEDGYYTNANRLVTLLDNHDLDRRILSEIRTQYPGDANKAFSFQIADLLYTFLFTVRGIPQIYYGSELGLEGWKTGVTDSDLRRDFPWNMIDPNNNISDINFSIENALFTKIKKLIQIRKNSDALKYGVTITLWVDNFVYAFLRYFENDVKICVFNNGFDAMQFPMDIPILKITQKEKQSLPDRIIDLLVNNGLVNLFDPTDKYRITNNTLGVLVQGKSYKILSN